MKILILGCGGIGSYLVSEIAESVRQNYINPIIEFYLADSDIVEQKNLMYQNFGLDDLGENKAEVLAKRYSNYEDFVTLLYPLAERIKNKEQLRNYSLIICCADNMPTRELIFKYCYENDKDFIDLRSEGRYVMAFQKTGNLNADLETLDLEDKECGSCQKPYEIQKGVYQKGNKVVAMIGVQMILNYLRGDKNSKILLRI